MLVRRARYCAPIVERKPEAAEVGCHPLSTIYPSRARTQPDPARIHPPLGRSAVLITSDYESPVTAGETISHSKINFESNPLSRASHACRLKGNKRMKSHFQVMLATLVVVLTVLMPASAYALELPAEPTPARGPIMTALLGRMPTGRTPTITKLPESLRPRAPAAKVVLVPRALAMKVPAARGPSAQATPRHRWTRPSPTGEVPDRQRDILRRQPTSHDQAHVGRCRRKQLSRRSPVEHHASPVRLPYLPSSRSALGRRRQFERLAQSGLQPALQAIPPRPFTAATTQCSVWITLTRPASRSPSA